VEHGVHLVKSATCAVSELFSAQQWAALQLCRHHRCLSLLSPFLANRRKNRGQGEEAAMMVALHPCPATDPSVWLHANLTNK
jgi:hypothetical protein